MLQRISFHQQRLSIIDLQNLPTDFSEIEANKFFARKAGMKYDGVTLKVQDNSFLRIYSTLF